MKPPLDLRQDATPHNTVKPPRIRNNWLSIIGLIMSLFLAIALNDQPVSPVFIAVAGFFSFRIMFIKLFLDIERRLIDIEAKLITTKKTGTQG